MRLIALLLVICLFSLTSNAQQKSVNVDGTWLMNVETTAGNGSPTFVLKHLTDSTITGTYKGSLGESEVKGTVTGNKIRIEFTIQANLIEYTGTVDGDQMKGQVKLGTMAEGTFTGKREKS